MKKNIRSIIMADFFIGKMLRQQKQNPQDKKIAVKYNALIKVLLPCVILLAGVLNFSSLQAQCYFEDFSASATGWSNPARNCATNFGCFLGPFSHTQTESSMTDMLETQKTFTFSSTTGDITIKFQLNEIDFNDPNNWWSVRLNGTTIIRNQYGGPYGVGGYGGFGSTSWDPPVKGSTTTPIGVVDWNITPLTYQNSSNPASQNYGFQSKSDQKHQVTMVIHNPTTSTITMAFYDMLDQGVSDEAFGYDNIYLCRGGSCNCNSGAPPADLSIVKTGPATVLANGSLTYTITVTNNGTNDASGATIMDPSVANFTQGSVACTGATGGASCPSALAPAVLSLNNLQNGQIPIFVFPAGSSVTFTVTGTAGASGLINNTATVTAPVSVYDANQANNSSTATTNIIIPVPVDLSVIKTGPATITPGEALSYNLVITNNGPSAADGATISDPAVVNYTKGSVTCVSTAGGAACPTGLSITALEAGTVTIPTFPSGGSVTLTITGTATGFAGTTIINTATVTPPSGFTDTDNGNNTSNAVTAINLNCPAGSSQQSTLLSYADAATGTVFSGTIANMTGAPDNVGPSAYSGGSGNVEVVHFPAAVMAGDSILMWLKANDTRNQGFSLSFSSDNVTFTGSATITSTTATTTAFNTFGALVPAGIGSVSYVKITALATGVQTYMQIDAVAGKRMTCVLDADVQIVKSGPATVAANSALTYTLVVTNNGAGAANNATVKDASATNFTTGTVTCSNATGGATCPATSTIALLQAGTLAVPTLPSGGSITFTVTGTSGATTGTSITNIATITPPAGVNDPTPGNNTSMVVTNIIDPTQCASGNTPVYAASASGLSYTGFPTANGVGSPDGALVQLYGHPSFTGENLVLNYTNVIPANTTLAITGRYYSASYDNDFTVEFSTDGGSTFTNLTNAAFTNTTLQTIGVTLPSGLSGVNAIRIKPIYNAAAPYVDVLIDAVQAGCKGPTDLQIMKTGTTKVAPNGTVTYNLVITNNGPNQANNATISDPVVSNFSAGAVSCTSSAGGAACPASPTLAALQNGTLSIPTLPANSTITLTVTGTATGAIGSAIVNTATVSPPAGVNDSNPSNNSSTANTAITDPCALIPAPPLK